MCSDRGATPVAQVCIPSLPSSSLLFFCPSCVYSGSRSPLCSQEPVIFLKCTSDNLTLGLNPSRSALHGLSVVLRINLHPLVECKIHRSDPTSSPASSHTTPRPNPQITVGTHTAPFCPGNKAQASPAAVAPALQAEGAACAKAPRRARPEGACCLFQDGETGGHSGPGHMGPWEGGEEGRLSSRRQEGC